ncbi:L-glutamine ABC transporter membrane protein /L-glutamate ABC transporter membrane protein /L-aspartate ABC transporter membrane protein /L-asparagine ABC transporter membrane protein [Jannaschia faecimaris]|uniref:L-glutamine ABC transporter membrane protein /L-glutamate ABC transporter membrane protein /L-aspartate ABC transporter membrane protein /L-asparagine ABC transporter membrane protein n=1 Tax=Jannaschia faecimaris TaxID=1244108 RepID=A0A1H3TS47_9RHOB|nr:ABC transporter permease subunit [Jannaschia faecimaris]SDZ52970.1 L-glutamine ABC transporter membrane protein /L-glutamate ABC transporter membrane protein /L-aspartate ABC transporter membrane protein /L-asparagine ABC transporter membrane protein [Jannaschia faecimaris]
MTTMTDPPNADGFRIGQLISDKRYRSYTFQFFALAALVFGFGWLINNAINNPVLQEAGIDFGFLQDPAGYDINQQPIEYTSQSSHMRAAVIGAINTLIVAFLGCVTATVFGVIAGVLRLSNNWIISKLMAIYVEMFRNVPVLIWILIIFTVAANVFPPMSEFRLPRDGSEPERTLLFGMFAATNQGVYVPRLTMGETGWIVILTFLASIAGVFGLRRYARQKLYAEGKLIPILWPSIAVLIVPAVLMQLILGSPLGLEYPEMARFSFDGGFLLRPSLIALWFALSIYTGAFIAENVRAGILAVSKGQTEAAAALGLRPRRIMGLVVLPQALRVIIPPLISQYLNITKNSSLAIAVGYMDLTGTLGGITLNQTGRALECILLLMAFYLTISLAISAIMNVYNNSVKLKER